MSRLIKTSMSELLSIDNLPTGSVQLLMRRHEMPNKICVERYWGGKVEKLAYVPEKMCHIVEDEDTGILTCSECGAVQPEDYTTYFCWCCGARIEVGE